MSDVGAEQRMIEMQFSQSANLRGQSNQNAIEAYLNDMPELINS